MDGAADAATGHVRALAGRVVEAGARLGPLRAALLDGSGARGDADFVSDVDLLLYVDEARRNRLALLRQAVGGERIVPIAPYTCRPPMRPTSWGGSSSRPATSSPASCRTSSSRSAAQRAPAPSHGDSSPDTTSSRKRHETVMSDTGAWPHPPAAAPIPGGAAPGV
jgi:hypothetical protein